MFSLTKYIQFIITVLFIVSCGGGGDDAKENKPVINEVPITESVQTTDELVSNSQFEFSSGFNLTVVLSALGHIEIQHFVNVCSDYQQEGDAFTINYDSCKLRSSFTEAIQEFELALSAAETSLIAQIWPIENDAQPINVFWHRTDGGETWQIEITNQ